VITLLVSPPDAQKLTLATMEGRIQLALRNPLDLETPTPSVLKNAMLYGRVQAPARKKEAKVVVPPATPVYTVELIRGDKRDIAKF
jgi:Flp pilus assembly protein CpaB